MISDERRLETLCADTARAIGATGVIAQDMDDGEVADYLVRGRADTGQQAEIGDIEVKILIARVLHNTI